MGHYVSRVHRNIIYAHQRDKMRNYGYLPEKIEIGKDYVFGGFSSIGGEILQPDGKWDAFLPQEEDQNLNGVEPFACVSFTTLNCVEIIERRMYGRTENFSDRFLATISGTKAIGGNSPQTVAEALRKKGCVRETELPFSSDINTYDEFYGGVTNELQSKAMEFPAEFEFLHEYVAPSPAQIKEALKKSPLGVSVHAWLKDDKGLYYKPQGAQDNHFTVLFSYEEGHYWRIFDSYDNNIKFLRWDYPFGVAKRYSLKRQVVNETAWQRFITWLRSL